LGPTQDKKPANLKGLSLTTKGTSLKSGPHGLKAWTFTGKPESFVRIHNNGKLNLGHASWTVATFFRQDTIRNGPILEWRGKGPHGTHFWIWGNTLFTNLDITKGRNVAHHFKKPSPKSWHFIGASYNVDTGEFMMWIDSQIFKKNPGKGKPRDMVGDVYIGIRPSNPKFNPFKGDLAGMVMLKGPVTAAQLPKLKEQIIRNGM
jgi:hypothetical protein